MLKGNHLLDTTTVASLDILLSSAAVTYMCKMVGPKVRVVATKAMVIRAMVIIMVIVVGWPMVRPMLWMPMSNRGI